LVCWGELLWDLFPDGPRLGGAAANVAYHAAQLGQRVALVSRVGNDELGARAISELLAAGVDVCSVQVDADCCTGSVEVELHAGEPSYRIKSEAAWDRIEWTAEVARLIGSAQALYYGTLAQRTPLGSGVLARALARTSGLLVCDLNLRPPFADRPVIESSLAAAHAVKLNEAEAQELCRLFAISDAEQWLLQQPNVMLVAQTSGARGATLSSRSERCVALAEPSSSGGDAVGAGDAFSAVLAIEMLRGSPLAAIAARANRYAGYVASQPGAMPKVPPEFRAQFAPGPAR
jgi:fructokinase